MSLHIRKSVANKSIANYSGANRVVCGVNVNVFLPLHNRISIQARLFILCLAVSTPLLIIGSFIISKQYVSLSTEARRATTFQAAITGRTLNHWIASQEDELKGLAALPDIKALVEPDCQLLLNACQSTQSNWQGLTLTDLNGNVIVSTIKGLRKHSDVAKQNFFREMVKKRSATISGYSICPFSNKPAILCGAPVISNGQLKAVLIASIKPQALLQLFAGLGEKSGTVITITDKNHRVLMRTLESNRFLGRDFSNARTVKAAAHAVSGTLEVIGIADPTPRAYAFDHIPKSQWLVAVGVPIDIIYGPAKHWLTLVLLLAFAAICSSIVLAFHTTRKFTIPINAFIKEALAIGRGDLDKRVRVLGTDEFSTLAKAFNEMATNLEIQNEHTLMVERISESIRQSLDLGEILNITVSQLGSALNASRCLVALVDSNLGKTNFQIDKLSFDYEWCNPDKGGTKLQNRLINLGPQSIFRTILQQGSTLSLDVLNATNLTPLFGSKHLGSLTQFGQASQNDGQERDFPPDWLSIKSMMGAPIWMHGKPLGLILVQQCDNLRTWIDPELELIEAVARHVALAMEQANLYGTTRALAEQELLINHIVRAVRSSLDLNVILNTVTRELGEAINASYCQIVQPRPEGPLYVSHEYYQDHLEPMKGLNIYGQNIDFTPGFKSNKLKSIVGIDLSDLDQNATGESGGLNDAPLAVISDVATDERAQPFREFLAIVGSKSFIAAPLLEDNRLLGVLIVHQCERARKWKQSEASLVAAIADQVAVAISHAQLFAQVKQQAITDGLTGLYNHVYLKNRLTQEMRRAQRKNVPLSLLMLDLDLLKQINDTYGHPVGDQAIRQVAWTLKNLLRSGDTAARYGGEEFAVILPETSLAEAAIIAERLCKQVNSNVVPGLGHISISVGAAAFPDQAESEEELVEKADKALYVAKHSGRNQISTWSEEVEFLNAKTATGSKNDEMAGASSKAALSNMISSVKTAAGNAHETPSTV